MTLLRIETIHAGCDLEDVVRIVHEQDTQTTDPAAWTYPPRFKPGARYLLALLFRDDGDYACVNGFLGAWRVSGDDLMSRQGRSLGSYTGALDHAATFHKPHRPRSRPSRDTSR